MRQLHLRLKERGLFDPKKNPREWNGRRYGSATEAAIGRFQRDSNMADDGVAGEDTLAALILKIVISRTTHRLTLYRNGSVLKSYGVAVGQARYPTPPGEYHIVNMQKNPTWTPPKSDWAKDAKPIPPGPKNPLGTRWMGLDAPNLGIHGTNNPTSIGFSVSHGCIRMAIPDVEDLYEIARVGTPVTIV